jgi:hypothetical protein
VSGIIIAAPQDQSNMQICMPLAKVIGVICCHQLCSAFSYQMGNPASLDKKSLVPALLSAPHMPHSAQMPFRRPTCLYGTTFAFKAPHLPFGAHICLNGAPFAFMVPLKKSSIGGNQYLEYLWELGELPVYTYWWCWLLCPSWLTMVCPW